MRIVFVCLLLITSACSSVPKANHDRDASLLAQGFRQGFAAAEAQYIQYDTVSDPERGQAYPVYFKQLDKKIEAVAESVTFY